jgi:hypothetical protein
MPARIRRTPAAAERLADVVALRRQRLTQADIARQLGISQQRVSQLYAQALAEVPAAQVAEHRAEELMLIDDAIADLLPIARDHTRPRSAVEAWNAIRGWADRKARLLGLDAPARSKVEVITEEMVDAEIRRLEATLGHGS